MKVIVADDSATIRRIMENLLSALGCGEILFADGGDVVLNLLGEHPDTDLILMDWNMPVMNGLDCLRAIRTTPATKDLAVVMVTSEATLSRIREAIKEGATNYLVKPFTSEKFNEVVRAVLKI